MGHLVEFTRESITRFACANLAKYRRRKNYIVFISLFHSDEIRLLVDDKVYAFLTRLYASVFERSHHIHLFAKHKRASPRIEMQMRIARMSTSHDREDRGENACDGLLSQLMSFHGSSHLLSELLSHIVKGHKVPAM